jgi:hypothetical protein
MMGEIFVFGSNLAGRHGAGSALQAVKHHHAVYGVGVGPTGTAYAIPTKDEKLGVLPLSVIRGHVIDFLNYAERNPQLHFRIVAIGCGLAGYTPEQIAPMFADAPDNCILPDVFHTALNRITPS